MLHPGTSRDHHPEVVDHRVVGFADVGVAMRAVEGHSDFSDAVNVSGIDVSLPA